MQPSANGLLAYPYRLRARVKRLDRSRSSVLRLLRGSQSRSAYEETAVFFNESAHPWEARAALRLRVLVFVPSNDVPIWWALHNGRRG